MLLDCVRPAASVELVGTGLRSESVKRVASGGEAGDGDRGDEAEEADEVFRRILESS